jgi:hypothetical protein
MFVSREKRKYTNPLNQEKTLYTNEKNEKQFYLPGNKPELISIPKYKFFTIK